MSKTSKTFTPESPTTREVMAYIQAQLAKRLIPDHKWDQPKLVVSIGLGCPHYPVSISIHSLTLDRQAAIILNDLGIPDALATSGSYRNFNDDNYLSISPAGMDAFGKTNKEKILEWLAQRVPPKPVMQRLYEDVVREGIGEKLDHLINAAASRGKGAV